MKAYVDKEGCIGCGLCADVCPEVFDMGDDGLSYVVCDEIPNEEMNNAQSAVDECPVSVISIK